MHLHVHLVQQAADTTHAEVAERLAALHQLDKGILGQQKAETVLIRQVHGTGGPLAQQGGHGKAFTDAQFEGGFIAGILTMTPLTIHSPLLDDV